VSFVKKAAGAASGRHLLDIGCGQGTFLLLARQHGWNVAGTEMNPDPPRREGLTVYSELSELPPGHRFDCITLWHSLEHLRDPVATIRDVRELLAPAGMLMIAVPDAAGIQASVFGREWLHLDVPRHLFHFDRRALRRLLHTAGFAVERWWNQELEYDLMGWSQSALNMVMPSRNGFFEWLAGRPIKLSPAQKVANLMGGALFSALALPLVPMSKVMRRGGTLVVAARPQ
jgi:SAM-dependent methyltransferase